LVTCYFLPEKHRQIEHIRLLYKKTNVRDKTHWLIHCDLDEFFYGVDKKLCKKLKHLEMFNVIKCNWIMFGHENLINHPEDIRKAILHREPNLHILTKCIFKPALVSSKNIEIHSIENVANQHTANRLIRLNHYPIQSLEFFTTVKMTRGAADSSLFDKVRDMNYFHAYNVNATLEDTTLKSLIENPPANY